MFKSQEVMIFAVLTYNMTSYMTLIYVYAEVENCNLNIWANSRYF